MVQSGGSGLLIVFRRFFIRRARRSQRGRSAEEELAERSRRVVFGCHDQHVPRAQLDFEPVEKERLSLLAALKLPSGVTYDIPLLFLAGLHLRYEFELRPAVLQAGGPHPKLAYRIFEMQRLRRVRRDEVERAFGIGLADLDFGLSPGDDEEMPADQLLVLFGDRLVSEVRLQPQHALQGDRRIGADDADAEAVVPQKPTGGGVDRRDLVDMLP